MTDKDIIDMCRRCASEIQNLRAQVTALTPRADAYDAIKQILGLLPRHAQGYGEDLVWKLEKQIADLEAKKPAK